MESQVQQKGSLKGLEIEGLANLNNFTQSSVLNNGLNDDQQGKLNLVHPHS